MYNANVPSENELPTSGQLFTSTMIALIVASVVLVVTVLPSEYGIDPTGIGRVLGLTQMGKIKIQLERENKRGSTAVTNPFAVSLEKAPAQEFALKKFNPPGPVQQTRVWKDEVSVVLVPGQGIEYKLVMKAAATAQFYWSANGGLLNYDKHGDGKGASISYEKGRGVPEDEGVIEAAFDGNHGWFWRNRTDVPVTLTLRTKGSYSKLKRLL
jgi:hypothetical protein